MAPLFLLAICATRSDRILMRMALFKWCGMKVSQVSRIFRSANASSVAAHVARHRGKLPTTWIVALVLCVSLPSAALAARPIQITQRNRATFLPLPGTLMRGVWCRIKGLGSPRLQTSAGRITSIAHKRFFVPNSRGVRARAELNACRIFASDLQAAQSSSSASSSASASSASSAESSEATCNPPDGFLPIMSEVDLRSLSNSHGHYYLCADIALSGPFAELYHDSEFNGVFDGGNHYIRGLQVGGEGLRSVGMFGLLGNFAVIRDLTLKEVAIDGDGSFAVGALAGLSGALIQNVHIERGTVQASGAGFTGTMIGVQAGPAPEGCSSSALIEPAPSDAPSRLTGFQR